MLMVTFIARLQDWDTTTNPNPPQVALEKELVFCYTDFNDKFSSSLILIAVLGAYTSSTLNTPHP